jgi:beta-mannosidase
VTSWSIVDYFLRPKPAYFTVARELRPFTVGMTRKDKQSFANERSAADFTIETVLEIWGTNSTLSSKGAILEVTAFDLDSNWTEKWEIEIILAPNSSTELYKDKLPGQPERTKMSDVPKTIVVSARLLDENNVLGRYSNWYADCAWFRIPFHNRYLGRSLLNSLTSPLLKIWVSTLKSTKMARVSL